MRPGCSCCTNWRIPAREDEAAGGAAFLERYAAGLQAAGVPADRQPVEAWAALARVVLTSNEFMYLD